MSVFMGSVQKQGSFCVGKGGGDVGVLFAKSTPNPAKTFKDFYNK